MNPIATSCNSDDKSCQSKGPDNVIPKDAVKHSEIDRNIVPEPVPENKTNSMSSLAQSITEALQWTDSESSEDEEDENEDEDLVDAVDVASESTGITYDSIPEMIAMEPVVEIRLSDQSEEFSKNQNENNEPRNLVQSDSSAAKTSSKKQSQKKATKSSKSQGSNQRYTL